MMFQELNKKEKINKGRITMRRSIYLFAMLSLFVVGCSEQSSVLAPVNNANYKRTKLDSTSNGIRI